MQKTLGLATICSCLTISFLLEPTLILGQKKDTVQQWYNKLPTCPCKDPDFNGVRLNDGWAKDKGNLAKYHKGAKASFRSYPPIRTTAGNSCQQCCYDRNGVLITSGRAAGTPDKSSSCRGEDKNGVMTTRIFGLFWHYWKDVRPWASFMNADSTNGWAKYNALWIANAGNNCNSNVVSK